MRFFSNCWLRECPAEWTPAIGPRSLLIPAHHCREFNDTRFALAAGRFSVIRAGSVNFGKYAPAPASGFRANIHRRLIGRVNNLLRAVAALLCFARRRHRQSAYDIPEFALR